MTDRLRVIVSGLAGASPVGGMAWHYFQYVLGLARLGHDVVYHEDTWLWPFDPVANTATEDAGYSAHFIGSFFKRYGGDLPVRWHYRHLHRESHGMDSREFDSVAARADLWLNVSGASFPPSDLDPSCVRAFVDTDPGYNQMLMAERFSWSENVDRWIDQVRNHDVHLTFAENIGSEDCTIPDVGIDWIPTRMPLLTDMWRGTPVAPDSTWSTVMTWNAFKGPVVHGGREYFSKGHEFRRYIDTPRRSGLAMTIALGGRSAPMQEVADGGWRVVDGPARTRTADSYHDFVTGSRGEFSTAKNIYVSTASGWFSERTGCYLAAGRPAVVQDTGFSKHVPTGRGLLTFTTPDEALAALKEVEANYEVHSQCAADMAQEYFDATVVLPRLLDQIGAARLARSERNGSTHD